MDWISEQMYLLQSNVENGFSHFLGEPISFSSEQALVVRLIKFFGVAVTNSGPGTDVWEQWLTSPHQSTTNC